MGRPWSRGRPASSGRLSEGLHERGEYMKEFIIVARDAVLRAGELLRENLNGSREISYKGEINLVTEMDRRSERMIVETLSRSFPEHRIMAEEETIIENGSEFMWIIDPLDGTTNYAHGYPCFSVSVALERSGVVILGIVYDPMRNELFTAVKENGAYLNDERIRVSTTEQLIQSLLSTGFPYDRNVSKDNNLNYFSALIMASQEIRRDGSAALDLCAVAAGRFDGFWELKLNPWDVAAGSIIVEEAGGTVTNLSGEVFSVYDKAILASNGKIHKHMVDVLKRAKNI